MAGSHSTARPSLATPLPTPAGPGDFWPRVLRAGQGLNVPQVLQLLLQLLHEFLEGRPLAWLQLPAALHQRIDGGWAALGGLHAVPLLQQLRHLLQALSGWKSQLGPPLPCPAGGSPWPGDSGMSPSHWCQRGVTCGVPQHSTHQLGVGRSSEGEGFPQEDPVAPHV